MLKTGRFVKEMFAPKLTSMAFSLLNIKLTCALVSIPNVELKRSDLHRSQLHDEPRVRAPVARPGVTGLT